MKMFVYFSHTRLQNQFQKEQLQQQKMSRQVSCKRDNRYLKQIEKHLFVVLFD